MNATDPFKATIKNGKPFKYTRKLWVLVPLTDDYQTWKTNTEMQTYGLAQGQIFMWVEIRVNYPIPEPSEADTLANAAGANSAQYSAGS